MNVPLVDLRASFLPIKERVLKEFGKILDGMELFLGPHVQTLERDFAAFCETRHGIGVSNGTDALIAPSNASARYVLGAQSIGAHNFSAWKS